MPSQGQSYAPTVNDLSAGIESAEPRVTWLTKVLKPGECEVIEISAIAHLLAECEVIEISPIAHPAMPTPPPPHPGLHGF